MGKCNCRWWGKVVDAGEEEVRLARDRFADSRRQLAMLWVRGDPMGDSKLFRQQLARATEAKERAESALAELSASFRDAKALSEVGIDGVAASLGRSAALVEYVRVPTLSPGSYEEKPRYVALILTGSKGRREFADLGPAAAIDDIVQEWRHRLKASWSERSGVPIDLSQLAEAGSSLRRLVWDPVAAKLGDIRLVFVVPDGSINQVNLSTLPAPNEGHLIDQGFLFHLLGTGRDLVRLSSPRPQEGRGGLLLIGNPDYEAGRETRPTGLASADEVMIRRGVRGSCDALQSLRWGGLPHSAAEVQEIAALFAGRESALMLTEAAASEEQFKRNAPGKRVLHLATHGFFLQDRCVSAENLGRGIEGLVAIGQLPAPEETAAAAGIENPESSPSAALSRRPPVGDNPLLLSGLVLAGANRAAEAEPDEDDGILTAEEITALDLRGVDLVALSACDTGLGAVEVGEGVMGLRRAFELAGARTVLMSLWSVPDKESRDWMPAFYRGRIEGASVADASRRASLSALEALRAAGHPEHPYIWAGFVAAGDWK